MSPRPAPADETVRLSIAAGLDVVLISDNEALIQFGSRSQPSELLRDGDLTGLVGKLLRPLLHGPKTSRELLLLLDEEQQAEAQHVVADLWERGILVDAASSPIEHYLRYTFTGDSHLSERHVTILGAGPLGACLARSLLQQGVRSVDLLDERSADARWYSLMPFGATAMVGSPELAHVALARCLREAGFEQAAALTGGFDPSAVERAVGATDLTIVALEQPHLALSHLVNRIALKLGKPWLRVSLDGSYGEVGPLFIPYETACFNDYVTLADAAKTIPQMEAKYRKYLLDRGAGSFFPGLPAHVDIAAGYAGLAVVHYFLRESCFALGRVLVLDFDRMVIDVEDVLKLPRCPVCSRGGAPSPPPFPADVVAEPSE